LFGQKPKDTDPFLLGLKRLTVYCPETVLSEQFIVWAKAKGYRSIPPWTEETYRTVFKDYGIVRIDKKNNYAFPYLRNIDKESSDYTNLVKRVPRAWFMGVDVVWDEFKDLKRH
jgi:hypothetical protein